MNQSSISKLILWTSVFLTIIFLASISFQWEVVMFPSLFLAFFGTFIVLIDHKMDRLTKGVMMILCGIAWGILLPEVVDSYIPSVFSVHWLLFKNIAIYACSGAGGSLIAAHAELGYKKSERTIVNETIIDRTKQIENLIASVENLKKTTLVIHGFYGVILLISIFVFVI